MICPITHKAVFKIAAPFDIGKTYAHKTYPITGNAPASIIPLVKSLSSNIL